jgi:hypothetical protein
MHGINEMYWCDDRKKNAKEKEQNEHLPKAKKIVLCVLTYFKIISTSE